FDVGLTVLYEPFAGDDERLFQAALDVIKELENYELVPDRIVCAQEGINLYFQNVCVMLGDKVSTEKVAQISPILSRLEGQTGTLHLERFEEEGDPVTFDVGEMPAENAD